MKYVEARRSVNMRGRHWSKGDVGWVQDDVYNPERFHLLPEPDDHRAVRPPDPPPDTETSVGVAVGQAAYVAGETVPPTEDLAQRIRALAEANPDKTNRKAWRTDGILKVGFVEKELGVDVKELDIRAALS